jgi:hypothetical protein
MCDDRAVTATFVENWPAPLVRLAPPHVGYALSPEDLSALVSQEPKIRALLGCVYPQSFSSTLEQWIADVLPRFQCGVFARLGMYSFTTPQRGPRRLTAAWQVLRQLAHPGERAASMAFRRRFAPEPVWLFLRAWRDIPPWTELRLFFRDRQLVGVTQLHSRRAFPELMSRAYETGAVIHKATAMIVDVLHLPHVVVDIRLTHDDLGFGLVELNPSFRATGPGLFSWIAGGDFDRNFRYRRADGQPNHLPLDTLL